MLLQQLPYGISSMASTPQHTANPSGTLSVLHHIPRSQITRAGHVGCYSLMASGHQRGGDTGWPSVPRPTALLGQGLAITASARGAWAPLSAQPGGCWLPALPWCSSWRMWHSRCAAGSLQGQGGTLLTSHLHTRPTAPFSGLSGTVST